MSILGIGILLIAAGVIMILIPAYLQSKYNSQLEKDLKKLDDEFHETIS